MEIIEDRSLGTMTPIRYASFGLSLIGVGITIWLTIAHFTTSTLLACPGGGIINCAKVTTSAESYFIGVPVAIWGLLFYVYLSIINSPWGFKQESLRVPRLGSMFLGVAFVLYLISAELLVLDSICIWCTAVHVITVIIFVLVVYDFFAYSSASANRT